MLDIQREPASISGLSMYFQDAGEWRGSRYVFEFNGCEPSLTGCCRPHSQLLADVLPSGGNRLIHAGESCSENIHRDEESLLEVITVRH